MYGHVFVTSALLGGQQRTSKLAAAMKLETSEDRQEALRSAFGAKVNAQYISASMQGSRARQSRETRSDEQYVNLSYLGTSTNGGDTLIGSDIPKWAATVSPHKNWRVIENELAEPIHELTGRIDGWDHIPSLFRSVLNSRPMSDRPWTGKFSLLLDGKPLCWVGRERDEPYLLPTSKNHPKAIFTVVSAADPKRSTSKSTATMSLADFNVALYKDWPLFLSSKLPGYESDLPVVTSKYKTGACRVALGTRSPHARARFSLRTIKRGQWHPEAGGVIRSGDLVYVYSHSLGLGPYAHVDRPPHLATLLHRVSDNDELLLPVPHYLLGPEAEAWDKIAAYDEGNLPIVEQEDFERLNVFTTNDFIPAQQGIGPIKPPAVNFQKTIVNYRTIVQEPLRSLDPF